jgi:NTP pyrophosphatase (non-canonical NTP hydrolase)
MDGEKLTISELVKLSHEHAKDKGFYDNPVNVGERLMLAVSELGEAINAHRTNKTVEKIKMVSVLTRIKKGIPLKWSIFEKFVKDTMEDELADAVMRICDLCGALNIDLERHIKMKMHYNAGRPYKYNKDY